MSTKGKAESFVEMRGSLKIPDMITGKSAYEIAVMHGFQGTEEEWIKHVTAEADRSEAEANRAETEADRANDIAEKIAAGTYSEKDPTVPDWAKQPAKPTYTAAEIGAAPAGFGGFGEQLVSMDYYEDESDLNSALSAVLSTIGHGSSVQLKLTPIPRFGLASGTLVRVDSSYAYLDVHGYGFSSLHKNLLAGVWQPWEWFNPPMQQGVEYRTTERFNGKPVYTKLVNCGEGPIGAQKKIAHGISNGIFFDYGGAVFSSVGDTLSLPWFEHLDLVAVSRNEITIESTDADYSAYTFHVWLKYYKSTD